MEAGLQVFTEGGNTVQIDSNYANFRLSRRIRVVGTFNEPKTFVCLPNHIYAVAAAKYGGSAAVIPKHQIVNGVLRQSYAIYGEMLLYEFTASKRNPSPSGIGLEMYAEDGSVNFSSNDYLLKVVDYKFGDLSSVAVGTVVHNIEENEVNADHPRKMFVLGLVPIRYTGDKLVSSGRTGVYTDFYQVSTLFFSRELVTSWKGTYSVKYSPFYYASKVSFQPLTVLNQQYNSASKYSYLIVDTSAWYFGLPPIELHT